MIQQTHRKIHFTEYVPEKGREKDTDAPPVATIRRKQGTIQFPKRSVAILQMEGKFISFYYEATKKIVGWVIRDNLDEKLLHSKKYRLIKVGKSGGWTTTIKGIVKAFNGRLTEETYNKLEVKKYIEEEGILERGTIYYYVELNDKYDDTEK